MNATQREKINRFLNDTVMSSTVREVILNAYLKPRADRDVQTLAASRIAIDLLDEAWKELLKLKTNDQEKVPGSTNVGL